MATPHLFRLFRHQSGEQEERALTSHKWRDSCRPRVFLSTSVAEFGATIEGLSCVVDCGMIDAEFHNSKAHSHEISRVLASKAMLRQRAGRVGRVARGEVYRLYTREDFRETGEYFSAAIHRQNLSKMVLNVLKHFPGRSIKDLDLLEMPTDAAIEEALNDLWALECTDDNHVVNGLGKLVWDLGSPDPCLGAMMVMAARIGPRSERLAICLAAALTTADLALMLHKDRIQADYRVALPVLYPSGDLEAYAEAVAEEFLDSNFKPLRNRAHNSLVGELSVIVQDYANRLEAIHGKVAVWALLEDQEEFGSPMYRWICPALRHHVARWYPEQKRYLDMRTSAPVTIASESVLWKRYRETSEVAGWTARIDEPRQVINYFHKEVDQSHSGQRQHAHTIYHLFGEMDTT